MLCVVLTGHGQEMACTTKGPGTFLSGLALLSGRVTMRGSSFWNVTVSRVLSTYAIVIFAMLWVGFAIALVVNPGWLDSLWNWVRTLPSVAEIILWVLFLPIMVGLWIWESSWSVLVRLVAFAGIVAWTLAAVSSFVRSVRLGSVHAARHQTR